MPPKKGQRKSMPGRINKAPTLTPSRRSPRVPPPQKSSSESSQSSKSLNITPASPQDNPINIRFYSPKAPATSPRSQDNPPKTPSSRRKTFQSRPSRLSNVYTPALETPATNNSRRTRKTAAIETPKDNLSEASDLEIPDSIESTGWTFEQYVGSFEAEGTPDDPSSPTSASDMRNSSRVRKPTRRAIESLETAKKTTRRKNTSDPTSSVEKPDSLGAKVAKNNVSKKPVKKTRTSKRMANSNLRKSVLLIGHDIDVKAAGRALAELTIEALSPDFKLPSDSAAICQQARDEYYHREQNEKYGTDLPNAQSTPTNDVEMTDQEALSDAPVLTLAPPSPTAPAGSAVGLAGYAQVFDPKIGSDGWTATGRINNNGEEVSLTSEEYKPHFAFNSYGYEGLPWPPVQARSIHQLEAEHAHGFPPFLGNRNVPADGDAPFVTENVQEEQARLLANAPAPAPEKKKKPRARKRRQTEAAAAEPTKTNGEEAADTSTTTPGGRKSQRRRQTAPVLPFPSPSPQPAAPSPPTATKVQSHLAVTDGAADGDKPKVQRLRLTLKPVKTETSGRASVPAEAPAVQSPSSPASSRAPSSAPNSSKRRARRG